MQREAEANGWTQDTELLATAVELIHGQLAAFIKANSKNPPTIEPLQIKRPYAADMDKKELPVASHEDIMRLAAEGGALDG